MCTVHRNRTLYRRYIRKLYCAKKQNILQAVHQKCVLCTGTEHFPGGASEMRFVQRKINISRRYITYIYIYICCTETDHFPDRTSEMCDVNRNRTLSRRCIRNACCTQEHKNSHAVHQIYVLSQKQNSFQTVHLKRVMCTETE